MDQSILTLFTLGALVFALCYHITMYISNKDKLLLNYIFYLFFGTLFGLQLTQFPEFVIGEKMAVYMRHNFKETIQILYLYFYFNFILQSVNVKNNKDSFLFKAWIIIMNTMIAYAFIVGLLFVFVKDYNNSIGFHSIRIFIFILTGKMLWMCYKLRGITFQRYILMGCSVYFVFGVISFITSIKHDKTSLISSPEWLLLGTFFDIIFFSFAIGYRNKKIIEHYNNLKLEDAKKIIDMQKTILEKQKALENERNRIAQDMNDDLGTGLTKITYLSQMGLKNKEYETQLTQINQTSKELVETMTDVIWAMKEENNSIHSLINYIKQYAIEFCEINNIKFKIIVHPFDKNIALEGDSRRNIFLSLKESLTNIVKHAQANNVVLEIDLNKNLNITLTDDGIGISNESLSNPKNGLNNIRKKIEKINGLIKYTTIKGTSINFSIPIKNI